MAEEFDKSRALVVGGNQKFADFFGRRFEVYQADTITGAYDGLSSGEIPTDCGIVIVNSTSARVNDGRGSMEDFISQFAPYGCVCVFVKSDSEQEAIKSAVVRKTLTNKNREEAPFYFISRQGTLGKVEESLALWNEWQERKEAQLEQAKSRSTPATIKKRKGSRIIAVTSAKGGAGKSTTAILLASQIALSTAAAGDPKKVCVVDMDVFNGQIGFMIRQSEPTVINLLNSGATGNDSEDFAQEKIRNIAITRTLKGKNGSATGAELDFYLAAKISVASMATSDGFYYKLVLSLTQMYDFVILDTGIEYITDNRIRNVCYALADSICYMTTLIVQSELDMARWFKLVPKPREEAGLGIPLRKIGIVINHAPSNVKDKLDEVKFAANPEWNGEGDSGINIIGAIPDAPQRVFAEAGNDFELERLLYDSNYGIGAAIFQLASNVVPKNVGLRPLVAMTPRSKRAPEPRETVETTSVAHGEQETVKAEPENEKKQGFFSKLFGKK